MKTPALQSVKVTTRRTQSPSGLLTPAKSRPGRTVRHALATGVVILAAVVATPRETRGAVVDTTFSLGADGLWNVGANWSNGVPNNGVDTYNVFIDSNPGTNVTVTLNTVATISNLTVAAGDALAINNAQSLTIANGGGVTNNGVISLNSTGSNTDLLLGLNPTLNGSGALQLGANAANRVFGSGTVTNSATHTISGGGSLGIDLIGINNAGTIDANLSGVSMTVDPRFGLGLTNTGTMRASNGGILVLSGNGAGTFNNTGGTISALAGSEVLLSSASVTGGTLSTSGGGVIRIASFVTAGVSDVNNTGAFVISNGATMNVSGSLNNTGTLTVLSSGSNTDLTLTGNTVLTGNGTLTFTGPTSRLFGVAHLTNDSTILGEGNVGVNQTRFTNNGLIDANLTGKTLIVDPGNVANAFVNAGILRASNGGFLNLTGNGGGVFTGTGGGIITATGSGSEVRLTGGVNIVDSAFSTSAGGVIRNSNFDNASLSNVTNNGVFIASDGSNTNVSNTITNNGTFTLLSTGNTTNLLLTGDLALTGTGTVNLVAPTSRISGAFRLTNSSTIQGEGNVGANSASITNLGLIDANLTGRTITVDPGNVANGLLNSVTGIMRASNGGFLNLTGNGGGDFTNNGTFEALNASTLSMDPSAVLTNNLAGVLTGGTYRSVATGGGTFASASLTNRAGSTISGFGNVTPRPTNFGLIRSSGGTLTFANGIQGGSGTVQIDPGSTLDLSGGSSSSSADNLIHNGNTPGSLNLGANNFLVEADYSNANFGTGNAFNKRANVAGSGEIRASAPFTISTAGSLNFGNVHVGDTANLSYTVNHNGTAGLSPQVRTALQTSVNGGNITDSRLSGAGVTASNLAPIAAAAASPSLGVTFTASAAGALTGQQIHVESNFDNVAGVNLAITGAAYRYANPTAHTPEPVNFGNFHVGAPAPSQSLSITNNVPADGFSEALNASIGGATGGVTASGSFGLLAPGATNNTALSVGISTATAGSKNGTATITLTSDGTGSSGLGTTALTAQTVNVTGAVFRLASPTAHAPEPVVLPNQHVGGTLTQALTVGNSAVNDGFSEGLNAAFTGTTGGATTSGSFTNLAAGSTNSTSLLVGVDTATAGAKSGTATLGLTSNGAGTSGLGITNLTSQTVNIQAQVNHAADADFIFTTGSGTLTQNNATTYTLNFGPVLQGTGTISAALAVLNFLQDATFQDTLGGTFDTGTVNDFQLSGFTNFSGLVTGGTSAKGISFDTAQPLGTYSDSLTFNPTSTNASSSLNLAPIQLNMSVQVVPEPASAMLLAVGGGMFLLRRRRAKA